MSDKPLESKEQIMERLRQEIKALEQKEAREKLARSEMAKPEGQPLTTQPPKSGDQAELQGLVAGKTFDDSTKVSSILEKSIPAASEKGMDQRVEAGPEHKDKEYWPLKHGPEG